MITIFFKFSSKYHSMYVFIFRNVNHLPRRGYMGHLVKISNNIVQQMTEKGPLGAFIKETVDSETLKNWEEFVNTKLAEINNIYNTCLVRFSFKN